MLIIFTISTKYIALLMLILLIAKNIQKLILQKLYIRFIKKELLKLEDCSTINNLKIN